MVSGGPVLASWAVPTESSMSRSQGTRVATVRALLRTCVVASIVRFDLLRQPTIRWTRHSERSSARVGSRTHSMIRPSTRPWCMAESEDVRNDSLQIFHGSRVRDGIAAGREAASNARLFV
jgi:hypothetical protein